MAGSTRQNGAREGCSATPNVMAHSTKLLYRLFFSERTILREGKLLVAGLLVYGAGSWFERPTLVRVGLWMTAPFTVTLLVVLVVLAPWFWLKGRGRG
jgi:hypothetical protein